jgi:hypothetical protein
MTISRDLVNCSTPEQLKPADKNWTFTEAWAAQEAAVAAGLDASDPTGPIFRWDAQRNLDAYRRAFKKGDKFALLTAINTCARHDLVMPDWVSREFRRAYMKVIQLKAGSWDDALGNPYDGRLKTAVRLAQARKRREARLPIYLEITELSQSRPIGDELFAAVGERHGVGKSVCASLYASAKKSLSQGRPLTPRKTRKSRRD